MRKSPIGILIAIYAVLTLTPLALWTSQNRNHVIGDEPHYLVIASAIEQHWTFEQSEAYTDEYTNHKITPPNEFPESEVIRPEIAHTVPGPHGLYNVHNIGLPLIIALPYKFGGILGAKLMMVFLGSLTILMCWKIAGVFLPNRRLRFWIVLSTTFGLPLAAGSSQIYPDLPAGLLAITGLYWLLTITRSRHLWVRLLLACTVAYLPWLQIKFAAACAILVVAIGIATFRTYRSWPRLLEVIGPAFLSFALLVVYNWYAFGRMLGPYENDALQVSATSLMVFIGLHIDQNQGFLTVNPVLLAGVIGIGQMYKSRRNFTLVTLLVYLAFMVPNAMHPNWYGGYSFSGRFGWSATIVFMIPTMFCLAKLIQQGPRTFAVLAALGFICQAVLFERYAIAGVNIYNHVGVPHAQYSVYFGTFYRLLPSLYDRSVAFKDGVNYVGTIFVLVLLGLGFVSGATAYRRRYAIVGGLSALAIANLYFALHAPL